MAEYIEREAALNFEVDSVIIVPGALQPFMDGMAFYADHIKRLPAADVAPVRHGWNASKSGFLCSACSFGDFNGFHGFQPRYCPNCGALMDKDGDGE